MERQHATNVDRFRQQAKELKLTVGKDLEEASVDSAGTYCRINILNLLSSRAKTLCRDSTGTTSVDMYLYTAKIMSEPPQIPAFYQPICT